jgi:predicted transcriptional regulator
MVRLFDILTDRPCINLLKALYDKELNNQNSYTIKLSEFSSQTKLNPNIAPLKEKELITADIVEGDQIVCITEKGKEFIRIFDQLIELVDGTDIKVKDEKKGVKVKYDLTQIEKLILVMAYKITRETGMDFIALNSVAIELYPYEDHKKKINLVSRYVGKLEEINLMERKREGRRSFLKVTEKGIKTINEQYLKELIT